MMRHSTPRRGAMTQQGPERDETTTLSRRRLMTAGTVLGVGAWVVPAISVTVLDASSAAAASGFTPNTQVTPSASASPTPTSTDTGNETTPPDVTPSDSISPTEITPSQPTTSTSTTGSGSGSTPPEALPNQ